MTTDTTAGSVGTTSTSTSITHDSAASPSTVGIGSRSDSDDSDIADSDEEEEVRQVASKMGIVCYCFHPNTLTVAALILAEGIEEVAVFLPLFATSSLQRKIATLVV